MTTRGCCCSCCRSASLSPIPETAEMANSPSYRVERRLGKGGFGQVYLGRCIAPNAAGAIEAVLKFEHKTSTGCNHGPPYEWQVYDIHSLVAFTGFLESTTKGAKGITLLW